MKFILFLTSSLLFALNAAAATVEVQVPAEAKTVVLTASDVTVDTCNSHQLGVLAGRGAATGTYSLVIVSTTKACLTPAEKRVTLTTESEIDSTYGQSETLVFEFWPEQIPNLKIEFK
jgi:hypothetical protein